MSEVMLRGCSGSSASLPNMDRYRQTDGKAEVVLSLGCEVLYSVEGLVEANSEGAHSASPGLRLLTLPLDQPGDGRSC